jgi:hypothetical protein
MSHLVDEPIHRGHAAALTTNIAARARMKSDLLPDVIHLIGRIPGDLVAAKIDF